MFRNTRASNRNPARHDTLRPASQARASQEQGRQGGVAAACTRGGASLSRIVPPAAEETRPPHPVVLLQNRPGQQIGRPVLD